MSLLWCDGFDHYGVVGNLTDGPYAEIGAGISLSTINPRTGSYGLRVSSSASESTGRVRRVLGAAYTSVGIAGAFYYANLPISNNRCKLFDFRDAANAVQVAIVVQSTGTIAAFRGTGDGTLLGTSAGVAITAETYQHVEAFVTFSNTVGSIEVRVNGVTVLSLTNQDTVASSLVECSQVTIGGVSAGVPSTTGTPQVDIDDIFCYNASGSYNNTFIGDRRVLTLFPNANTAEADWAANGAATGYECIDEVTPDDDTTYISSSTVGDRSEFDYQDLPAGISSISAVQTVHMSRKTDAGNANIQVSVVQGASALAGTDRPVTEVYTYWQDIFEVDPVSAAPFTPSEVNSLKKRIDRTL